MTLYIIVLGTPKKSLKKEENRALWIGFEKDYQTSRKKAIDLYPGKEPLFFGKMSFKELIYLFPFFNKKQEDVKKK